MLTKRDKLLIRPWIDQRYQNHRRKVQSAGPAIDFHAPVNRPHITLKLKKVQKEFERREQIEKENVRLLQKLGSIMQTKRIENFWSSPRPNFLHREYLYGARPKTSSKVSSLEATETVTIGTLTTSDSKDVYYQNLTGSYARCTACNGKGVKRNQVGPVADERIPYPPVKKTINQKFLKDTKLHACCKYCC